MYVYIYITLFSYRPKHSTAQDHPATGGELTWYVKPIKTIPENRAEHTINSVLIRA